jgi:hypothetical protein
MKKLDVDWSMLELACEDASWDHSHFLDVQTGEVIFVHPDQQRLLAGDLDDEEEAFDLEEGPDWERESIAQAKRIAEDTTDRYVPIPRADSHEAYGVMEDFIDTLSDERLQELLSVAIQRARCVSAIQRRTGPLSRRAGQVLRVQEQAPSRTNHRVVAFARY